MKAIRFKLASMAVFASAGFFAGVFLFASSANAQRTAKSAAAAQANAVAEGRSNSLYDIAKEVSLQGTVAKFTENSADLPVGAHVLVQTSSGQVDVHLGDPRLLKLNNLAISQGASIRIIGEPVTLSQGTFFLARLVQLGTQVVTLRTTHGMPVALSRPGATTQSNSSNQRGGAR